MKEPDFRMKLMSTYGGITVKTGKNEPKWIYKENSGAMNRTNFRYTKTFFDHFILIHTFGDYNKLQQSSPSIKKTWVTQCWPNWVFAYFLATSEVNTFLDYRCLIWNEDEVTEYAVLLRNLEEQLINN